MSKSKQPEFLVLKSTMGWLPEQWWPKLLGAAVLNPHAPTNERTPLSPPLNKNELLETEFSGFLLSKNDVGSRSFELDVKHLGHLRWQKSAGQNLELKGKLVYKVALTNRSTFWKEMMSSDQEFADKVTDWVNDKRWGRAKHEVCWITGLLMCQEVAVTASSEQAREWEAGGEVLLGTIAQAAGAAHGAPIPTDGTGDTSGQVGSESGKYSYFSAKGKGKYIFALELAVISSKKGKPELTDKAPKVDKKQKLGDDDEDDLEPEDLTLNEDLRESDWENLLQEG